MLDYIKSFDEFKIYFNSSMLFHYQSCLSSIETVPPMLSIPNQLEAAYLGQNVTLECQTEAYPASINYWTTEKGDMIISGNFHLLESAIFK